MIPEDTPFHPALEQAVSEIRGEEIPDAVVDAAAGRVWGRLAIEMEARPSEHIRDCAAFQSLMPDYRAGRLPEARALLVKDHLRDCVACRRVYEGRVAVLPLKAPGGRKRQPHAGLAVAAGVVLTGGLAAWFAVTYFGATPGQVTVRSITGTLYQVSADGLRPMHAGETVPDGTEIRAARGSRAAIVLADGSTAEIRERSDLRTSTADGEITVHLERGGVILQAAHRSSGHLYVATADCRVAVKGTLFSVSAGVKGSRVSVVEGEVSVSHENRQTLLRPGDQWSTSDVLQPVPVREDVGWSRNTKLQHALAALRESLGRVRLAQVRHDSRLLKLLPAATIFYASIPNLSGYLAEARNVFRRKSQESPELRDWLAGPGASIDPLLDKLQSANEYLGDEIVVFATAAAGPVVLAEVKGNGLPEFLKGIGLPVASEIRNGLVLIGPNRQSLNVSLDSTFSKTAFYQRIAEAYAQGAGLLVCADLLHVHPPAGAHFGPPIPTDLGGRYLIAEQAEVAKRIETRASLGFDGTRSGMAAWLAPPAPIGALDYITPEATLLAAFTVTDPAALLDRAAGTLPDAGGSARRLELRREIAATLGGEFAVALDGPPLPVPSWKIVAEVNDPARFEAAFERWVAAYNQSAAEAGGVPLRASHETSNGRTWFLLGWGKPNPLAEAHYTFASGYLIAAPTKALVSRALEASANGTGVARSQAFTALLPHDPYTDFSAVVYQNLGTTLAPFVPLLGPKGASFGNLKPLLVTAYAQPDRLTLASTGDLLGISLNHLLSGAVFGMAKDMLPMAGLLGTTRLENSSR
ncbi:MAG TPA: FecR domain-containing protein [Bryobacteraceae bacterium]|nr:FecR domain-containing protein [Bryobacteraceae bacterium]